MNKKVSLIITDLDNTLYDWLGIWHGSFRAMFDEVYRISGIDPNVLKAEFRTVFQKHGTSEYAFALQELPSLLKLHSKDEIPQVFSPAISAFRQARRANLIPYPGVIDTLKSLKAQGCLIVGYTESMSFYTNYRLRKLGLDLLLDFIYSPEDHELPADFKREQIRKYPEEHYALRGTIHKHTPKGEVKPNPKLLRDIISSVGGELGRTIYIGDSLMKDIAMAKDAGVTDIWAQYGAGTQRPEYELLRSVSHWPESTVQLEKTVEVVPSYALQNDFSEVLSMFTFVPFNEDKGDRTDRVLEMWKTTVGVQQHFNDLELRIRNYAVTLLVAVIGVTAVALKENNVVEIVNFKTTLPTALLIAGIVGWTAFYFMDRFWYHRLLIGSVRHGREIEKANAAKFPEIQLASAISAASPIQVCSCLSLRTTGKIDLFYGLIGAALLCVAIGLHTTRPIKNLSTSTLFTNGLPVDVISTSTNLPKKP